ncbi:MAG: hypothetical protein CMQ40_00390 [Gammaproteobacteria bacterium]|nr:hypothetical protein [Gammaproteobacteria bacterium]
MNNEITFLLNSGGENKSPDQNPGSQPSDFVNFFKDEINRKSGSAQIVKENPDSQEPGLSAEEESKEATNISLIGKELPKLELHKKGLAIGRLILTPKASPVSNKSLNEFIRNQTTDQGKNMPRKTGHPFSNKNQSAELENLKAKPEKIAVDPGLIKKDFLESALSANKREAETLDRIAAQPTNLSNEAAQKKLHVSSEQSKKPINAIFESFERQLNSRLAIVNSSLVNQKTAGNTEQTETLKKSFEELSETIKKSRSDATERKINSGSAERNLSTKIPAEPSLKNSVHNSRIARKINSARLESQLKNLTPDNKTEKSGSKKPDIDQLLSAYANQDKPHSITNGKAPIRGTENQSQSFKEGLASVESKAESRNFVRETITNTSPNQPQSSQFESVIQKFSDALSMRLISAVQQNQWNLQLKLNPASLGEINVTLDFNEGNLEGKLYATEETTRTLLQESLSRLKFGLKENLENYQAIDVFIGDKKDHPDNQNKTPKSMNETQEIDLSEEIASKTQLARTISSGRIDIQV